VVVALELVDVLGRLEGAIELDEEVGDHDQLGVAEAQLDGEVGLDGGELLNADALPTAVGSQEAVRRAATREAEVVGSDRAALTSGAPRWRCHVGVAWAADAADCLTELRLER
jgi:hypothetical protein